MSETPTLVAFDWDKAEWHYEITAEVKVQVFGSPQAVASLFGKWNDVQANMPNVPKRGKNPQFSGHRYHKEEDIYAAVRPLLAEHRLAFFSTTAHHEIIGDITHLDLLIVIGDRDTGAMMVLPAHGAGMMRGKRDSVAPQDRAVQMAWTSAMRYFFGKNLLIDDVDNEIEGQEEESAGASYQPIYQPAQQAVFNEEDGDKFAVKFAWNGVWCIARGELARQWRDAIEKSVPINVLGDEKKGQKKGSVYIEVTEINRQESAARS